MRYCALHCHELLNYPNYLLVRLLIRAALQVISHYCIGCDVVLVQFVAATTSMCEYIPYVILKIYGWGAGARQRLVEHFWPVSAASQSDQMRVTQPSHTSPGKTVYWSKHGCRATVIWCG